MMRKSPPQIGSRTIFEGSGASYGDKGSVVSGGNKTTASVSRIKSSILAGFFKNILTFAGPLAKDLVSVFLVLLRTALISFVSLSFPDIRSKAFFLGQPFRNSFYS